MGIGGSIVFPSADSLESKTFWAMAITVVQVSRCQPAKCWN